MERTPKAERRKGLHKREVTSLPLTLAVAIGATVISTLNGINFIEYRKEHDKRVELQEVYPSLGEQLYYQGYPEIMRLKIDVGDDTFSFVNLSDEKGPSVCSGVYEYHPHTALKIGQILCVELEDPGTTPSEPVSL